jgi:DNA primase
VPIRDVWRRLGRAAPRGAVHCPFHTESEPSFRFYERSNHWHCFGCGGHGTVIDLIVRLRGCSPLDAAYWLLTDANYVGTSRDVRPDIAKRHAADPEVLNWLINTNPLQKSGYHYLKGRGFSELILSRFQVAQIGDEAEAAARNRWSVERLRATGLYGTHGSRLIFPAGTIVFPFFRSGEITYVQGRAPNDVSRPRWLSLFGVPKPLFNVDALQSRPTIEVYLCEGVTDTLAASQLGLRAVGVLGATSLTLQQAAAFKGRSVILLPDADQGGHKFQIHVATLFRTLGVFFRLRTLPSGTDVADRLRGKGVR